MMDAACLFEDEPHKRDKRCVIFCAADSNTVWKSRGKRPMVLNAAEQSVRHF
jgi:hypothetical protein